ncbi:hypothetical protein ACIBU0_34965 [Streptomyces sp. NPDC049627]|uniref:hypothetical protein n=1 Tax=Streptomyces sp. NPDC049627 TaxID=3365595 RepID=UPI0037B254F7
MAPPLRERLPTDISRVMVLRLFGVRAEGARNSWNRKSGALFIAVSYAPPVVVAVSRVRNPSLLIHGGLFPWLLYYSTLNLIIVLCQWSGCRVLNYVIRSVDEMMTARGRLRFNEWIDHGIAPARQLRYMAGGSLVSMAALFLATTAYPFTNQRLVLAATYAAVAMTGAAGANCLYWILRAAILSRVITATGCLSLWWVAPASTPGMESLARWYRLVTAWSAIGLTVSFVPVINLSRIAPDNGLLTAVKWTLAVTLMAALVLLVLYSHWRLSLAVAERRMSTLRRLNAALPRRPPVHPHEYDDEFQKVHGLLKDISSGPTGMVNSQTLASMVLALLTGAVPFVVALLVG